MASLTELAQKNQALLILLILLVVIAAPISFTTHPSRENPEITIRAAVVTAEFEGMSPERVENLITRRIEEKIREIPEVKDITSTSRNGRAVIKAEVHERFSDMEPIWRKLRDKMEDVKGDLPTGTRGPFVNDDYGNIAMATIALTGEGFSSSEMRYESRALRDQFYSVPGVKKAELHGIRKELIYLEFDDVRMAQLGISANVIQQTIRDQNVVMPGGELQVSGMARVIEPSGNFESIEEIANLALSLPGSSGQVIYLRDVATVWRGYQEPAERPVTWNGKPAIILSISMMERYDALAFGDAIKARVAELEKTLPIGYTLDYVTFQPAEISIAINGVLINLLQTVSVVLVLVMLFLGWRTGLIVGTMVPLTMMATILIMRYLDVELERMSLATLIISLGLLVDNGIVVAEDIGRRIGEGAERGAAAVAAGRTLALPLLTSSLTTIFAFLPLMLAESTAGEFTRSISIVIAIALLVSWFIAMTLTPVLCQKFIRPPVTKDQTKGDFFSAVQRQYRPLLSLVLRHRAIALSLAVLVLVGAVMAFGAIPKAFFPASERTQLQVVVHLPVGSNTNATGAIVSQLSDWLMDPVANPEIESHVAYVGYGGPRFYLGLDPVDPDPHRGFLVINVKAPDDVSKIVTRIRHHAMANIPEALIIPKPLSAGPGEAGLVEFRVKGPDVRQLKVISEEVQQAMRKVPQSQNIRDDMGNPQVKLVVNIDQTRARRVGVTSATIARGLKGVFSGTQVDDYREGDQTIPMVMRSVAEARTSIDRLRTLGMQAADGSSVPLMQIAQITGQPEIAILQRRNMEPVVHVTGRHATLSAESFDALLAPAIEAIELPAGYRIEIGGELADSSGALSALAANVPLAVGLILIVLVLQFNSLRRPLIILVTIPLAMIGVSLTLNLAPGSNFGFMGILGLLALMGIIINNAIVLIDRIETERERGVTPWEAVLNAGVARLRPILMTTATTVAGLLPILLSRDVMFYDLALVVAGGLIIGTLLTLFVVPCLYVIVMRVEVENIQAL